MSVLQHCGWSSCGIFSWGFLVIISNTSTGFLSGGLNLELCPQSFSFCRLANSAILNGVDKMGSDLWHCISNITEELLQTGELKWQHMKGCVLHTQPHAYEQGKHFLKINVTRLQFILSHILNTLGIDPFFLTLLFASLWENAMLKCSSPLRYTTTLRVQSKLGIIPVQLPFAGPGGGWVDVC